VEPQSCGRLKMAREKTIGTKQTTKAVLKNLARAVYVARDADEHVIKDLVKACSQRNIPVTYVESMVALGKACGIEVGAASVAIIED